MKDSKVFKMNNANNVRNKLCTQKVILTFSLNLQSMNSKQNYVEPNLNELHSSATPVASTSKQSTSTVTGNQQILQKPLPFNQNTKSSRKNKTTEKMNHENYIAIKYKPSEDQQTIERSSESNSTDYVHPSTSIQGTRCNEKILNLKDYIANLPEPSPFCLMNSIRPSTETTISNQQMLQNSLPSTETKSLRKTKNKNDNRNIKLKKQSLQNNLYSTHIHPNWKSPSAGNSYLKTVLRRRCSQGDKRVRSPSPPLQTRRQQTERQIKKKRTAEEVINQKIQSAREALTLNFGKIKLDQLLTKGQQIAENAKISLIKKNEKLESKRSLKGSSRLTRSMSVSARKHFIPSSNDFIIPYFNNETRNDNSSIDDTLNLTTSTSITPPMPQLNAIPTIHTQPSSMFLNKSITIISNVVEYVDLTTESTDKDNNIEDNVGLINNNKVIENKINRDQNNKNLIDFTESTDDESSEDKFVKKTNKTNCDKKIVNFDELVCDACHLSSTSGTDNAGIFCDRCHGWHHYNCVTLDDQVGNSKWYCVDCFNKNSSTNHKSSSNPEVNSSVRTDHCRVLLNSVLDNHRLRIKTSVVCKCKLTSLNYFKNKLIFLFSSLIQIAREHLTGAMSMLITPNRRR